MEADAHKFQYHGSVEQGRRTTEGRIGINSLIVISRWQNNHGDTVYTRSLNNEDHITDLAQIQALSDRVKAQRADFEQLGQAEQTRLLQVFYSSQGTSPEAQSFRDHLQNEALGETFDNLRADPPGLHIHPMDTPGVDLY